MAGSSHSVHWGSELWSQTNCPGSWNQMLVLPTPDPQRLVQCKGQTAEWNTKWCRIFSKMRDLSGRVRGGDDESSGSTNEGTSGCNSAQSSREIGHRWACPWKEWIAWHRLAQCASDRQSYRNEWAEGARGICDWREKASDEQRQGCWKE